MKTTTADVLEELAKADRSAVNKFLLSHLSLVHHGSLDALMKAGTALDGVKSSLVFFQDAAHYTVQSSDGYAAAIVGPVVIPVGKSSVYIVDNVLANPAIIVGSGTAQ